MRTITDVKNKRFCFLITTNIIEKRKDKTYIKCICDCGNEKFIVKNSLVRGITVSCGCFINSKIRTIKKTHGMSKTKAYRTYVGIKQRCYNPKFKNFNNYGGRGISICDRWLESFENFFTDMGVPTSENHSLDRINNDGNYEPSNCRWATRIEQGRNTRKNVFVLNTLTGIYYSSFSEAAEIAGINRKHFGEILNGQYNKNKTNFIRV
jgi:hypothetical protein